MKKFIVFTLIFSLFSISLSAQNFQSIGIPVSDNNDNLIPLRKLKDLSLQIELNTKLKTNKKWARLIAQDKMSVGLVDMRDIDNIKFASVNGNDMMYAASMPKIAVLLACMDAIEKGELKVTKEVKRDMKIMIEKSNNQATTRMIDRVGFQKIEDVLTHPDYKLYDMKHGGGLWVGKRYAGGGKRNPDPMEGLSHAATVDQVCRYYYLLAHGQLVSPQRSKQMLDIMVDPKLHHKFVNTLDKIAPKAKVFRKSGSWRTFHSDSAMVWGPDRKYILVAMVDDPKGEQIMRKLVHTVDKVLKPKKRALAKK